MVNSYFIENTGIFYFKGKDRINFLNRISTNDFRSLKKNDFIKTFLLTEKGRIVDMITVLEYGTHCLIKTTFENYKAVTQYINKYIFAEDVSIEEPVHKYSLLTLFGDEIIDFINKEFNAPKPEDNRFHLMHDNSILYFDNYKLPMARIIADEESMNHLILPVQELHKLEYDEYENLRIENDIFESSNEMNENVNPLECGLTGFISFSKGCYIGQEVVARLDSHNKLPKQVVKFESDSEMKRDDLLYYRDSNFVLHECGFVSSTVRKGDGFYGFAFVRSIYLESNVECYTMDGDLVEIKRILPLSH